MGFRKFLRKMTDSFKDEKKDEHKEAKHQGVSRTRSGDVLTSQAPIDLPSRKSISSSDVLEVKRVSRIPEGEDEEGIVEQTQGVLPASGVVPAIPEGSSKPKSSTSTSRQSVTARSESTNSKSSAKGAQPSTKDSKAIVNTKSSTTSVGKTNTAGGKPRDSSSKSTTNSVKGRTSSVNSITSSAKPSPRQPSTSSANPTPRGQNTENSISKSSVTTIEKKHSTTTTEKKPSININSNSRVIEKQQSTNAVAKPNTTNSVAKLSTTNGETKQNSRNSTTKQNVADSPGEQSTNIVEKQNTNAGKRNTTRVPSTGKLSKNSRISSEKKLSTNDRKVSGKRGSSDPTTNISDFFQGTPVEKFKIPNAPSPRLKEDTPRLNQSLKDDSRLNVDGLQESAISETVSKGDTPDIEIESFKDLARLTDESSPEKENVNSNSKAVVKEGTHKKPEIAAKEKGKESVRGSGNQSIRGSGNQSIRGSGNQSIRGSGRANSRASSRAISREPLKDSARASSKGSERMFAKPASAKNSLTAPKLSAKDTPQKSPRVSKSPVAGDTSAKNSIKVPSKLDLDRTSDRMWLGLRPSSSKFQTGVVPETTGSQNSLQKVRLTGSILRNSVPQDAIEGLKKDSSQSSLKKERSMSGKSEGKLPTGKESGNILTPRGSGTVPDQARSKSFIVPDPSNGRAKNSGKSCGSLTVSRTNGLYGRQTAQNSTDSINYTNPVLDARRSSRLSQHSGGRITVSSFSSGGRIGGSRGQEGLASIVEEGSSVPRDSVPGRQSPLLSINSRRTYNRVSEMAKAKSDSESIVRQHIKLFNSCVEATQNRHSAPLSNEGQRKVKKNGKPQKRANTVPVRGYGSTSSLDSELLPRDSSSAGLLPWRRPPKDKILKKVVDDMNSADDDADDADEVRVKVAESEGRVIRGRETVQKSFRKDDDSLDNSALDSIRERTSVKKPIRLSDNMAKRNSRTALGPIGTTLSPNLRGNGNSNSNSQGIPGRSRSHSPRERTSAFLRRYQQCGAHDDDEKLRCNSQEKKFYNVVRDAQDNFLMRAMDTSEDGIFDGKDCYDWLVNPYGLQYNLGDAQSLIDECARNKEGFQNATDLEAFVDEKFNMISKYSSDEQLKECINMLGKESGASTELTAQTLSALATKLGFALTEKHAGEWLTYARCAETDAPHQQFRTLLNVH